MTSLQNLRIVFMGTPDFAVASLAVLVNYGCTVVGVITAPDKPAGRGMQLQQSAVKKYALEKNLNILQPEKLKNPEFIQALKNLRADIQVVVAFRMLPEMVWNMPSMGTVNVHASLLPQYRGAAPINWAIINGEKETGITTFKLQQEIDTGNILLQEKISIGENETAGQLHDRLKLLGAQVLLKTLKKTTENNVEEIQQSAVSHQLPALKHAPKINTDTCKINWNYNAEDIFNLVRGLSPFPAAFTYLDKKMLKIFSCTKEIKTHGLFNGGIDTDGKTYIRFACADGFINCTDIQMQGKKRMPVGDFLRGYRINN